MDLQTIFWIGTILAPIGAIINAAGHKNSFLIWIIANTILFIQTYFMGIWNLQLLYLFYLGTAVFGYFSWRRKEGQSDEVVSV